jgi:acetate kinase
MNVLVLNSGSSSLKYKLIDTKSGEVIKKNGIERIGITGGAFKNHADAVKQVLKEVKETKKKVEAIGHRVVHGGEVFKSATVATDETLAYVEKVSHLAPLHNPANIMGIRACRTVMPEIPNVMVFDTAFHNTIPASAYLYAIPTEDYQNHGIRRYGFHGTSHNFVSRKCAEMYGKPREDLRIITIHLGGGCSICAIEHGRSVETSMGLTPLEGLVMETRSGDIDPAAVQYIAEAHKLTIEQAIHYLNKESGLKALAGIGSPDMRDLIANFDKPAVQTALDVYAHRLIKYVGAYVAVMGGVDAIAWTGGVGSNMPLVRDKVMSHLEFIGANVDLQKSATHYNNFKTGEISSDGAKVRTFVITTNEELEIATEVVNILIK